jgi:hypothetical protein
MDKNYFKRLAPVRVKKDPSLWGEVMEVRESHMVHGVETQIEDPVSVYHPDGELRWWRYDELRPETFFEFCFKRNKFGRNSMIPLVFSTILLSLSLMFTWWGFLFLLPIIGLFGGTWFDFKKRLQDNNQQV